jgi:hypothetical protein
VAAAAAASTLERVSRGSNTLACARRAHLWRRRGHFVIAARHDHGNRIGGGGRGERAAVGRHGGGGGGGRFAVVGC